MNNRTTVELYRQTLRERLQIAEKTRSPSITLMTSEVQVLHDILKDHIKLMREVENDKRRN